MFRKKIRLNHNAVLILKPNQNFRPVRTQANNGRLLLDEHDKGTFLDFDAISGLSTVTHGFQISMKKGLRNSARGTNVRGMAKL